jgi:tRNA (cytidine/uridine-2'-O-)-methyltransferase
LFHVVLYEPEIPPNTGNVIRLCANTGATLHLIEPLGFELDDKQLKRAGLDYHEWANVNTYANLNAFTNQIKPKRVFAFSTKAKRLYATVDYQPGDAFLFGPETRGLPTTLLAETPAEQRLRVAMLPDVRSLNLSNAVAVVVYEAWRQLGFPASS